MKKRILVVDDDSSVRGSLQKILTEAGHDVTVAVDGESAEGEFHKADLLVLDLNLPIQDGWDVLARVNSEYPILPVIVITGLADQLDDRSIPGASAFMEKPVDVSAFLQTVERLLNQTLDERLQEAGRAAESWPSPFAAHSERRPRPAIRRFRIS